MILRTPPPQRKRQATSEAGLDDPADEHRLVIYEDPPPSAPLDQSEQMICSYQCRQMVKTEVIDALTTAEKQALEYRSRTETLEKELAKLEQDKNQYKDKLRYVEQEFAASRGREGALQQQLLKEVSDSQERYRLQVHRCSELEVKLKKEEDLRKSADASAQAAQDKILNLEEKVRSLVKIAERNEKRHQKENFYVQDEASLSNQRLTAELERVRSQAEIDRQESELLKDQMEELRERLNEMKKYVSAGKYQFSYEGERDETQISLSWLLEKTRAMCIAEKRDLEQKCISFSAPSSEVHLLDESQILIKHLQEELRNYEAEVQEARKLRSFHTNAELLKEKLLEEKSLREKAEAELVKLHEAQFDAENMENELKMWKSLIDEIPGVSSFNDISVKFATLQKEAIDGMIKLGEVTAQMKELEVALDLEKIQRNQIVKQLEMAKESAEESTMEVKRVKQMIDAVTEERNRLKNEVLSPSKIKSEGSDAESHVNPFLKELENSLVQKEDLIKAMENSIQEQGIIIHRLQNEIKILSEQLNCEERKSKSLEREGDRLRAEVALLESKLGHGDYSTKTTQVLRMANTLGVDDETKQTIEALRSELLKTKAKLQTVEEFKGQSDAGNLIDADISEKLSQLKNQIATLVKREERYKTVFADKISIFRRACCSLFGYQVVMDDHKRADGIPVTQFTLQSIYAQSDDEKLVFEYESGNAHILATDYSSQPEIARQVDIFIKRMNSTPAFTANLTVESFNKRTLS